MTIFLPHSCQELTAYMQFWETNETSIVQPHLCSGTMYKKNILKPYEERRTPSIGQLLTGTVDALTWKLEEHY